AVRTGAGIGPGGAHLYLAALDGTAETSAGLTVAELASLLQSFGAVDAVNLDGGGSSTFAVREPGDSVVTVLNHPTAGAERPVANGIGIFTRP
ncbi:MAG: phosphodiester glycosidase family protein, partial [Candidatus Dormibacteraeota bacterium]|nr:phosphodiester glycosidase family protein [Candidatus Dormibacteraeota bacterium]MBO0761592.1 phosphodiester glycosidase family protein [Candidatus Dormibacteraeota bacterium]